MLLTLPIGPIDVGDVVTVRAEFRDDGALVDPTTVTGKTKLKGKPGETTLSVARLSLGIYETDVTATAGGTLLVRLTATGPAQGVAEAAIPVRHTEFAT